MTKQNSKFTIIRDTREKENQGWIFEPSSYCAGTEIKKLDTGDYSISGFEDKICIERKGSIEEIFICFGQQRERFYREIERMNKFEYKYLILECTLREIYRGSVFSQLSPLNVISSLLGLCVKYNIHIVYAGSGDTSKMYVESLIKKIYSQITINTTK